jgi:hypothetical protein
MFAISKCYSWNVKVCIDFATEDVMTSRFRRGYTMYDYSSQVKKSFSRESYIQQPACKVVSL